MKNLDGLMLSRRHLLAGLAAAAVADALGLPRAFAKAPLLNTQAPVFYRFKIGSIEATAVSDGPLAFGEPKPEFFSGVTVDDVKKLLGENFLPNEIVLEQNALVINTGDRLALFDTGLGATKMFGPSSGQLLANLKAAGVDPKDVDAIILTHAHPDHCWALMGEGGTRNFPNAQIYVSQADFDFWTDEAKSSHPQIGGMIGGTRAQLLPNRDRLLFVKDGAEVIPGVQAMSAPGHTVGHTIYMINSGGKSLCVTADLAHHHVLMLENPRVQFAFDSDGKQASDTRIRVFDMLAAQRIPLIAYHFPWPGIGHVAKRGDGFRYFAAPMQTAL
jgi:glyoxylase-like metal-dependent hydrolase (beta-lactamase superfamily II)